MGMNVNRSSELSEIGTGLALVAYVLIVGTPIVATTYADKNFYTIGISSLFAAITGVSTIVFFFVHRQLRNMTIDELRTVQNHIWDIEQRQNTSPEVLGQRRENVLFRVKKIGLCTLVCSIASLGTAYYLSSP